MTSSTFLTAKLHVRLILPNPGTGRQITVLLDSEDHFEKLEGLCVKKAVIGKWQLLSIEGSAQEMWSHKSTAVLEAENVSHGDDWVLGKIKD